jgi:hypothetical protein
MLQDGDLIPGDFAQDANGEAGSGEGVATDEMGGDVE